MKSPEQPKPYTPEEIPIEVTKPKTEAEIRIEEETRKEAQRIGLEEGEKTELYVDMVGVMEAEYKPTEAKQGARSVEIYNLVKSLIEKDKNFDEALDLLEYFGAYPGFFSADRKQFKEFAERAREISESERDTSLPPFDQKEEIKLLRALNARRHQLVKKGKMSSEEAKAKTREEFEKHRSEREWQREGVAHLRIRAQEEIERGLQTAAGISYAELRVIMENPKELERFMEVMEVDSVSELMKITEDTVDIDKLANMVEEKAEVYRLTREQRSSLEKGILQLVNQRGEVAKKRKEFKDDNELVRDILGREPQGKIEIVETPFALYLRCHHLEDFAFFTSRKFSSKEELNKEDILKANKFRAAYIGEIYIAENAQKKPFLGDRVGVYFHEERHVVDYLFKQRWMMDFRGFLSNAIELDFEKIEDKEKKKEMVKKEIQHGLREFRESGEWNIAAEFLAFLKQGEDIEITLLRFREKKEKDLYGYFDKGKREEIFKYVRNSFESLNDLEIHAIINDVLAGEYHKNIDEAAKAIKSLWKNRISRDKIISLLQPLPLHKWPAEARRVARTRKKRQDK